MVTRFVHLLFCNSSFLNLMSMGGKETHPELDQSFDEAVILLDEVVEVLPLPQFTRIWQDPFRLRNFLVCSILLRLNFCNRTYWDRLASPTRGGLAQRWRWGRRSR